MNDRTAGIILDCLAFFELSDHQTLDPDAAVNMVEHLASELKRLDSPDRRVLLAETERRSVAELDARTRSFYAELPKALGIER